MFNCVCVCVRACVRACVCACVYISGKKVGLHAEEQLFTATAAAQDAVTVTPHVTDGGGDDDDDDGIDITTVTSSVKARVLLDNETLMDSTSVNITGLEYFTEYMVKVCVTTRQFVCVVVNSIH